MKFCPRCGKKGIVGEMCNRCLAEVRGSVLEYKPINIKVCIASKRFFYKNKWIGFSNLEDVIKKIAKEKIKQDVKKIKPLMPEIMFKPGINYDIEIEVDISAKEKYFVTARVEMTVSPQFSKIGTQYFEGCLQVRNPGSRVEEYIEKDFENAGKRGVFVSKRTPIKNGYDLLVSSQRYVQNLGKRLQQEFGGELKVTSKLFGIDKITSKELYRVNVFYEAPLLSKNDVVKIGNKIIKITNVKQTISGVDLKTGNKVGFKGKNEKPELLEKKETTVVKDYPAIGVLDPETYQPVKAENSKKVKIGEKVLVVEDCGKFYIV